MLLFEQLDLFARIAGDAVRAPRLFGCKNGELASKSGKLTALPARSPGDVELESKARDILESVGAFELAALVRVEWNPRLRSAAGRAHFEEQLISLNPRLREHGTAESIGRCGTNSPISSPTRARVGAGSRRTESNGNELALTSVSPVKRVVIRSRSRRRLARAAFCIVVPTAGETFRACDGCAEPWPVWPAAAGTITAGLIRDFA